MTLHRLTCLAGIVIACAAAARRQTIPVPVNGPELIAPPANETIPPAALADMYRTELGSAYDPVAADQFHDAHVLLENYFSAPNSAQRKSILAQLQTTGLDPNVLGRLCRIRLHWPALSGGGTFYANQKRGRYDARYFLGVPKSYDRSRSWPLVIALADVAPFLAKPPADSQAVVKMYRDWIAQQLSKHGDAIVLMPLLDLDQLYGPSYAGNNLVIQPLLDAADRCNIDPARVYLCGHSIAAMGVWNIGLQYPTYFAAINPQAGAITADWQRLRLMNLNNVLPVIWHDDDDKVIKVGFSKSLAAELHSLRVNVDFSETQGLGHDPSPQVIDSQYQKMRAKVRNLYPTEVWIQTNRPDVIFDRSDWVQIYQESDPGKEHALHFLHEIGRMSVYENSCSLKGRIHGNQIDVNNDNVATMRFYLNDQLISFAAPVIVSIDGKTRFKDKMKPDLDLMLKDQLFLGRGWRYYTAAVDIDLVPPETRPATQPAHKGKIIVGPSADGEP